MWEVCHEVCDGHLAAREERGPPGQKTYHDEQAADQLDHAAHLEQRRQRAAGRRARHRGRAEQLLRAVQQEYEPHDDSHDRVDVR